MATDRTSTYTGPSNTSQPPSSLSSFEAIYNHLTTTYPSPVLPSPSPAPRDSSLNHAITSLHLHPTLEALLHILNLDLPSAHFLTRHMENRPAYASMYLHGVLHRIEGDYRNAELWYKDVSESDIFKGVWGEDEGALERAHAFIQKVEKFRKAKQGSLEELEKESGREIEGIKKYLVKEFGTGVVGDATQAWVEKPEKSKEAAARMVVGGEGWRQF